MPPTLYPEGSVSKMPADKSSAQDTSKKRGISHPLTRVKATKNQPVLIT